MLVVFSKARPHCQSMFDISLARFTGIGKVFEEIDEKENHFLCSVKKSKIMRAKVGNSCSFLAVKSNVISIITVAAFATMMLSTLAILSIVTFGNSI